MTTLLNAELSRLCADKGYKRPKGFSQPYYNHLGILNGDVTELVKAQINEEDTIPFQTIAAPTIAEVVMWLYEKHGIWIECLHRGDMGDFTFKVSKLKKGWRTEPHYVHDNGFNSPTKAYEAAIDYVLNNLI